MCVCVVYGKRVICIHIHIYVSIYIYIYMYICIYSVAYKYTERVLYIYRVYYA